MAENLGGIFIDIELETAQMLSGAKAVDTAMSDINSSAKKTGQQIDSLNRTMNNAASAVSSTSRQYSQAEKVLESLGNEVAILEEKQNAGARSAIVLAAQLRAGESATDAQRRAIGELAGNLYDMKAAQDAANSSTDKATESSGRMEMMLNRVALAIAGAFTLQAAQKIINIADEMSILQARVERLSPSIDAARATIASLSSIAAQTGNSLKDTEKLWESSLRHLKKREQPTTRFCH